MSILKILMADIVIRLLAKVSSSTTSKDSLRQDPSLARAMHCEEA